MIKIIPEYGRHTLGKRVFGIVIFFAVLQVENTLRVHTDSEKRYGEYVGSNVIGILHILLITKL